MNKLGQDFSEQSKIGSIPDFDVIQTHCGSWTVRVNGETLSLLPVHHE